MDNRGRYRKKSSDDYKVIWRQASDDIKEIKKWIKQAANGGMTWTAKGGMESE